MYSIRIDNYEGGFYEAYEWLSELNLPGGECHKNERDFLKEVKLRGIEWGWMVERSFYDIIKPFKSPLEDLLQPVRIFMFTDPNMALQFKMRL